MTKTEAGRMGALALCADREKKMAAVNKAVATIKATRPDFYSAIGKLGALKKKERKAEEVKNA